MMTIIVIANVPRASRRVVVAARARTPSRERTGSLARVDRRAQTRHIASWRRRSIRVRFAFDSSFVPRRARAFPATSVVPRASRNDRKRVESSFVRSIVRSFESRRPAVTSSIAMRGVPRFHSTDDAIDDDVVVLAQSAKRRDERRDEASGETSP